MSNLAHNNVEQMNFNFLYEYYEAFLSQLSENTAKNYKVDVKQFCNFVYKKEPNHITIDDVMNTKSLRVSQYVSHMKDVDQAKNATMKRKINAVKSFFTFLRADFPKVNIHIFDNVEIADPKLDSNGWGNIKWDEAEMMESYALDKQMNGNEMGMLIKLARVTSIRLEALLSLEWELHFFQKDERGIVVNFVEVIDKKKKHKKAISDLLYNELREKLGTNGKLFATLHPHKVGEHITEIVDALGFDKRRNIKFHSLKKCGVNRVIEKTGSIHKAKQQGNHSSITTTDSYYIEVMDDLTQHTSYTLDQDINITSELNDISKDELLLAIAQLSDSAQFELLRIIKKG